ncbi:pseudouridine synthase [Synechococcus sp. Nb3U1]|uniref:pseudouridine synthase n=1 Tax=Synechococcus sp. Nb3U1 TaxID=1914529 RepID=UPI001F1E0710|nr:pseudouridine synthase [Synechococcus sp. Nb3U1]MCF2971456.1 pseudouridine synthase [Synechococcus sp. Nb3U1]
MRYLKFYKPYGVLTQFTDSLLGSPEDAQSGRLTLKAFIAVPKVYPVGRLDRDSEGLLLLTDDGILNARLINPKFGHERTYWVQVEGIPTPQALEQLRQGVMIQGRKTRPAQARILSTEPDLPPRDPPIRFRRAIPTTWLELTLREGRNRQVRRMTAAVGIPTLRLVRVELGPLSLQGLTPGEWQDLSETELAQLRHYCS